MKKLLLAVLFVTQSLFAAEPADKATIASQEADQLRQAGVTHGGRIHSNATITTSYSNWIFIPAAGSLQGNFGTFYKSDLMIANYRAVSQVVRIRWIPQGGSGFATTEKKVTIPANTVVSYDNVVSSLLGYTGLGSLELVARTAADGIDLDAQIDAFSRIWTPQPNTTLGTVSQNFGGSDLFQIEGNGKAYALGLKQDGSFRTNVGIVNMDFFDAHTWTVQIIGTGGSTSFNVTVPAFSMVQTGVPAGNWGSFALVFTPPADVTSSDSWTAYGASSDNGTGDGWVSQATQIK